MDHQHLVDLEVTAAVQPLPDGLVVIIQAAVIQLQGKSSFTSSTFKILTNFNFQQKPQSQWISRIEKFTRKQTFPQIRHFPTIRLGSKRFIAFTFAFSQWQRIESLWLEF